MDRTLFSFSIPLQVRNYEVDWQGIVHNGNYLLYCEVSRIEYLKRLGASVNITAINNESRVVLVRNEINYLKPARLGEELCVHTRTSWIKNSSFAMEGLIERPSTGEVLVENVAIHAWLDPLADVSIPVPASFRELVRRFEGDRCQLLGRAEV
ncbi:MAG: acyl-CoA thioesterase [Bacteroidetes bacterium]|jgi:acyl-CoA thioester hydrolase|nr:acyl-CoA thioesterase [Bacteroidota bacterium]